jgi:2'-5' RNA ligase
VSKKVGWKAQSVRGRSRNSSLGKDGQTQIVTGGIATNLVVLVPEAEPALELANRNAGRGAELKAPAHITLVYPFMPPETLEQRTRELAAFFAEQRPFDVELQLGWFGREVLLLAPTNPGPLVALTEAVISRWPEYPYYGGTYDVIEPHLSLGFGTDAMLSPVTELVEPLTPVRSTVAKVTVLVGPHDDMRPGPAFSLAH